MTNKSKKILSEISAGELLDKISILEIKLRKIKDKSGQEEIKKEYNILIKIQNSSIKLTDKIEDLFNEIKKVNLNLWEIEDKLRICEKKKDFVFHYFHKKLLLELNNGKCVQELQTVSMLL